MRVLKLHHPTGHPYWQKGEYKVELPNGEFINPSEHLLDMYGGYEIMIKQDGIHIQICASGSGYGKKHRTGYDSKLIVPNNQYDRIEYVGNELKISDELKGDLIENHITNINE